jgi:hypothetical protein
VKLTYLPLALFTVWVCCRNDGNRIKQSTETKSLIDTSGNIVSTRFLVPEGFQRDSTVPGSFAYYLQHLPLKKHGSGVFLYNGKRKANQNIHAGVLQVDVGERDLQQCADAVMRLRADYLYTQKRYDEIAFNFVSDGKPRYFKDFCQDRKDYGCYKRYMNYIFSYANTRSLHDQLRRKTKFDSISIGDVLIQKGTPYGHAVIVVDRAYNITTGEIVFMLAQSYMPAQDIHILKNLNDPVISPWYKVAVQEIINTPEWRFYKKDLRFFE